MDPVRREEERGSADDGRAGCEAVQAVDEVEGVHGGDDQPGGQHNPGISFSRTIGSGTNGMMVIRTPQMATTRAAALWPMSFTHHRMSRRSSATPTSDDQRRPGQDAPGREVVPVDVLDEEGLAGHDEGNQHAEKMATPPSRDTGVECMSRLRMGIWSSSRLPTTRAAQVAP